MSGARRAAEHGVSRHVCRGRGKGPAHRLPATPRRRTYQMRQGPWVSGGSSELVFGRGVVRDEMWGVRLAQGCAGGSCGLGVGRMGRAAGCLAGAFCLLVTTRLFLLYSARVPQRQLSTGAPCTSSSAHPPHPPRSRRKRKGRRAPTRMSAAALATAAAAAATAPPSSVSAMCAAHLRARATRSARAGPARHHARRPARRRRTRRARLTTTATPAYSVWRAPRGRARCVKTCL